MRIQKRKIFLRCLPQRMGLRPHLFPGGPTAAPPTSKVSSPQPQGPSPYGLKIPTSPGTKRPRPIPTASTQSLYGVSLKSLSSTAPQTWRVFSSLPPRKKSLKIKTKASLPENSWKFVKKSFFFGFFVCKMNIDELSFI